eukprot:TRINITY_DN17131_c0_g1_i1.p1 TRINITY_DN17131_c0_g1~~TRINITY_DN17131_c0_g1_i1.p1  ORF type:complete len:405 (+),score=93.11 TRINITY_DN17131_c0_g1_i1:51-1265(+)
MMLWVALVILLVLLPSAVLCAPATAGLLSTVLQCASRSNTSCAECASSVGCDWCEATRQCTHKLHVSATCPDTWIDTRDDCWLIDALKNDCTKPESGCTNSYAINYKFRATTDDHSCVYQEGRYDPGNVSCGSECICKPGGLVRKYGRYCAFGYTGCPASQPCDALDLCCQIHDWCVTVESYPSCECGHFLHNCVASLTDKDFEGACPYMKQTAKMMMEETAAQIAVECLNHEYDPKCGPEINCNSVGTCRFDGGCDCPNNGNQHYRYDQFGRTGCECAEHYYPLCGDSDTVCSIHCDADTTCNGRGVCAADGTCACFTPYGGDSCAAVVSGNALTATLYTYTQPHTVHVALCALAVGLVSTAGLACAAATVAAAGVYCHRRVRRARVAYAPMPVAQLPDTVTA